MVPHHRRAQPDREKQMKTSNKFDINGTKVSVDILDVTPVGGEKPTEPKTLAHCEWDVADIPTELMDGDTVKTLAAYGFASLIQDRCSQYTDKMLGESCKSANEVANARLDAYIAIFDLLCTGQFTAKRAGGGRAAGVDVFFATGFMNFLKANGKNVDAATATAILQGMTEDQRKALRADSRILPHITEARQAAKDAAGSIDLTDLF